MAKYKLPSSESLLQCGKGTAFVLSLCDYMVFCHHYLGESVKSWLFGEENNPDRNFGLRISLNVRALAAETWFSIFRVRGSFFVGRILC